jgi:hypothetical protein
MQIVVKTDDGRVVCKWFDHDVPTLDGAAYRGWADTELRYAIADARDAEETDDDLVTLGRLRKQIAAALDAPKTKPRGRKSRKGRAR